MWTWLPMGLALVAAPVLGLVALAALLSFHELQGAVRRLERLPVPVPARRASTELLETYLDEAARPAPAHVAAPALGAPRILAAALAPAPVARRAEPWVLEEYLEEARPVPVSPEPARFARLLPLSA